MTIIEGSSVLQQANFEFFRHLIGDLRDDLEAKIASYREFEIASKLLVESGAKLARGHIGHATWVKARFSLVQGNCIETVRICQCTAQHILSAHIYPGAAFTLLPSKAAVNEVLQRCLDDGVIAQDDLPDLHRLMAMTNSVSHFREEDFRASEDMFGDATFAAALVSRLLALPRFGAAWSGAHPFAENYADDVAVGVASEKHHQAINLFSDLNQWMLKILLAKEIPVDLLTAPRIDCQTGAELAAAAGVSAMSASRLLLQLRNEGFLDEQSRAPRLVRRRELFERWRAAALRPAAEMPMRFVIRSPVQDQLHELIAGLQGNACLGLFAAADALKFGHVSGVPPHVCVAKLPQLDEGSWQTLRPASQAEAPDIMVRQAPFHRSRLRGAVHRDGWLASDVIQTWLDVGSHPVRGNEQADLIYGQFLRRVVEK